MQTVSSIFSRASKYLYREFDSKVMLNGVEINAINIVGFEIEEAIGDQDDIAIGNFIASSLKIKFRDVLNVNIQDVVEVFVRVKNTQPEIGEADWSEFLTMGKFYVDSTPILKDKILSVVAFDSAIFGDVMFESLLSYPANMQSVFNEINVITGFTLDASVVINQTLIIPYYNNTEPYTCRELIGVIAGANGANAIIGRDGKLYFLTLNPSSTISETIELGDMFSYEQTNPIRKITNVIVTGDSETFQAGSNLPAETLYVNNPFATQAIANGMIAVINGYTYMPINITWKYFPWLGCNDKLAVQNLTGTTWVNTMFSWDAIPEAWIGVTNIYTVILKQKISFNGGMFSVMENNALSLQENEYILDGTISRSVQRLNGTAVKETVTYNGVRITKEDGMVITRSDQKAKVIMSADAFTMQTGDGLGGYTDALKFDPITNKYSFTGDIIMSGGSISWGDIIAPSYSDIEGVKPPTNADNTFTTIGSNRLTYITSDGVYTGIIGAQHAILANAESTASLNFNVQGSYYVTLKTQYTTGGNSLFIGKTTSLGGATSNLERVDMFAGTLYVYNDIYAASSITVGGTSVSLVGHSHSDYFSTSGGSINGSVYPQATQAYTLGTESLRWNYVYGLNGSFTGNLAANGNIYFSSAYNTVISTRQLYINSGGQLGTVSSTERIKSNIEPYAFDLHALLKLPVVSFNFKSEYSYDDSVQHGVIAEQAQALGLIEFVQYDKDGIPDYFAYEKLPVALLQLCQELSKRIEKLESYLEV